MTETIEKHQFQAEARQLLDLMVHSIYTNKDIFLRELISNSSDALDRLRFELISRPELKDDEEELRILIEPNSKEHTLTVRDNGIGMTRDEVIELIGTIAKSGTKEFINFLKETKDKDAVAHELIGQFGVGFYSSFMAADRVVLETSKAGEDEGVRWESTGDGTYTVQPVPDLPRGTSVTLHLKPADSEDGLHDYTSQWQLSQIVKRYSDFVAYPIQLPVTQKEVERDEDGNPVEGAEEKEVTRIETLNSSQAIWLRDPKDVPDQDYHEFYKHLSHDWEEPLEMIRAKIEGLLEYRLLLFIPARAPFDMYMREGRRGVQLYVKRVFIMDDCKDLLPEYLRFVRGVVDSEDLSLNISRELLQQNRQIQRMRKGIVAKVLDSLKHLHDTDGEKYGKFWREFGRVMKEGIYQDAENREKLLELALFDSTASPSEPTSLQAYLDRMPPSQEAVYYMTGESREHIENSPHLEAFKEKGYEVLLLTEPVDEVWTSTVQEFKGKQLKSAGRGAVDLGTEEERKAKAEKNKEQEEAHSNLFECLKEKLATHIKEVRLSARLTSSPACLVTDEGDISPQLEQLLRASDQPVPETKRILEVNAEHPLLDKLQDLYNGDAKDPALDDYAELLYGQAVIAEGGQPPNPGKFSKLVADLMVKTL